MSEAAYELGIVCEARADRDTACGLADRVLLEDIDWLEAEMLDGQRRWRGLATSQPFLKWADVRQEATRAGLKGLFGHFQGSPGEPDALNARRALLLLAMPEHRPQAVLLVRDSDGDARRRRGLEQARREKPWPFEVVIGVAEPKRECWVLAGFEPKDAQEQARLEQEEKRLSFHPVRDAHRLDAREHGAKNDAKRALAALSTGDWERERACLEETALSELRERGQHTGLSEYLREVGKRLVPLLGDPRRAT